MIEVNLYRQFISELAARVNSLYAQWASLNNFPSEKISAVVSAMSEGQLVTLLSDRPGIILCGNVPGADISRASFLQSVAQCILYIVEKSPKDRQGTDDEFLRFAVTQRLMSFLCQILMDTDSLHMLCQSGKMKVDALNVEPEYNIYGGFCGWSVSFNLPDAKGPALE